jgi:hypothetical protein
VSKLDAERRIAPGPADVPAVGGALLVAERVDQPTVPKRQIARELTRPTSTRFSSEIHPETSLHILRNHAMTVFMSRRHAYQAKRDHHVRGRYRAVPGLVISDAHAG